MRVFLLGSAAFLLAGCGRDTTAIQVSVPALLTEPIAGCNASLLSELSARLHIAGHEPCDLTVATDLTVSGGCDEVSTGERRPLLIEYTLPAPVTRVPLAYAVGDADLRQIVLQDRGDEPVRVELSSDALYYQDSQLDALQPSGGCAARDRTSSGEWAVCYVREQLGGVLSCGDDGTGSCIGSSLSNLERACAAPLVCCAP